MAKALTTRTVEAVQPRAARREVPDGHMPGLYLVVQPSGARSWAVRYRHHGKPKKHTLGPYPALGLADARTRAGEALRAVAEGRDPATEKQEAKKATPAPRETIEAVAAAFIERHAKPNNRESSWRETERLLKKNVIPALAGKTLQEITRRDILDMLDGLADRGARVSANRTLTCLRKMFSWAIQRGIVESSPCGSVKPPATEQSRDRVLSDDEIRFFWLAADEIGWPFGQIAQLLLLTGQRRDEVGGMRWSEIDMVKAVWTIPKERAKNNKAHEVPLSASALAILSALPRVSGELGYVFTTTGKATVSGFSRAKERLDKSIGRAAGAEVPEWRFHDLRRTAASGMARIGINLPVIGRC